MAELTKQQKEALVKAAFPEISGDDLKWATMLVQKDDTADTYKKRLGTAPHILRNEVPFVAGAATGAKAIASLVKSLLTKRGAAAAATEAGTEAVKTAGKMSLKKKAAIGAVTLYGGSQAAGSIASRMGGNQPDTTTAQSQAEVDMANAVAAADAAGIDVNSIINSPAGQQLNLNSGNLQAFMAKFGMGTTGLTGIGNIGVFTGTETKGTKVGPKGIVYPTTKSEIVSLADWNKRFPSDAAGLAAAKQKFVNAGVLSPTDGIDKIKGAWEAYGKMSLEYSRAGNKLSPWQILDMQKGLSGSGSQTSVTIDTSPMAEADIRTLAKRQLAQSLGLSNIDDKMYKDILKIVRKNEALKPAKTVVTQVGNKTTRKTTPGYGQTDVLADIENYAKQDPRYSEFQTANVFGDALVKALGLKA